MSGLSDRRHGGQFFATSWIRFSILSTAGIWFWLGSSFSRLYMSHRLADICKDQMRGVSGVGGSSIDRGDGATARRFLGKGVSIGNINCAYRLSIVAGRPRMMAIWISQRVRTAHIRRRSCSAQRFSSVASAVATMPLPR